MRTLVATAMLLLQLQPVFGVALCSAMGGSEGGGMEAGCPMSKSGAGVGNSPPEGWSAPNPSHECVFSEACAPAPAIIHSAAPGIVSLQPQFDRFIPLPGLVLPTEGRSPPVPPPKS